MLSTVRPLDVFNVSCSIITVESSADHFGHYPKLRLMCVRPLSVIGPYV